MIKNTLQKIYLGFSFHFTLCPNHYPCRAVFQQFQDTRQMGGFTGKWYVALFQNEQIMNALYTTLIIALLSALIANTHRNRRRDRHSGNAKKSPYSDDGCHQYPDAKCRYRDWNFPNALIYRIPLFTWICNDPHGTHYVQHSLCHLKCHAKIKADKPSDL